MPPACRRDARLAARKQLHSSLEQMAQGTELRLRPITHREGQPTLPPALRVDPRGQCLPACLLVGSLSPFASCALPLHVSEGTAAHHALRAPPPDMVQTAASGVWRRLSPPPTPHRWCCLK